MARCARSLVPFLAFVLFAAWAVPAVAQCGAAPSTILYAGQTLYAGTVTVYNDAANIYVRYTTVEPWVMSEAHVAIADSLSAIPQSHRGNPIPGHFAYSAIFDPEVTEYTFAVPLGYFLPGQSLYIAAHAIVQAPAGAGGTQTGWGFGPPFPGANWATYLQYTVQSCGAPVQ